MGEGVNFSLKPRDIIYGRPLTYLIYNLHTYYIFTSIVTAHLQSVLCPVLCLVLCYNRDVHYLSVNSLFICLFNLVVFYKYYK